MRAFDDCHPSVTVCYFAAVSAVAMCCLDPVILFISLAGAVATFVVRNGSRELSGHLWSALLFVGMALVNPLVSHKGATVLLFLGDNPVTLESCCYGVVAAAMIVAVLYWFRSLSQIMTSDKWLFVFGGLSAKLALVMSMALRFVPLFAMQFKKVKATQTALGLYKDDNIVDHFKGGVRVFSVMITWALENGIVTADSMTARGYGVTRRSRYALFRFRVSDGVMLAVVAVLFSAAISLTLQPQPIFYPVIVMPSVTARRVVCYAAYAALSALPTLIQLKEAIKWRKWTSDI